MHIFLGILFLTIPFQIILNRFFKNKYSKIIKRSEQVKAKIIDKKRKRSGVTKYEYEYTDYRGGKYTGYFGDFTTKERAVGDSVEILYAISEPTKSIALEFKPMAEKINIFRKTLNIFNYIIYTIAIIFILIIKFSS